MKKETLIKLVRKLENNISWENWKHEETGEFLKMGDVFANKVQWILEEENLDWESIEALKDIQALICPILNELDDMINKT